MKNNLDNLYKVLTGLGLALIIVALFYAANIYREGKLIGSSATNTITVNGKGEMDVRPDISIITLTLRESGKDSKEGEEKVSKKTEKFLASVKSLVEDRDIKTQSYSSYPRYSYPTNHSAKIEDYEVTQSIVLKIRNTENVGKVLSLITDAGINEVSGPEYTIDDIEKYKEDIREIAIKNAKEKAEKLASQLGVELVRIVSFSEGSDYMPIPMYMRADMKTMNAATEMSSTPSLPVGENKVTGNVTITFEIK